MAVDSRAKRNSALKDPVGILFPQGAIDDAGRQTLVGNYKVTASPPPPPVTASQFELIEAPFNRMMG